MEKINPQQDCPILSGEWSAQLRAALALLGQAFEMSRARGLIPWEFAVEIDQLQALGVSNTDLRALVCDGFAEHAQERTRLHSPRRLFQPVACLTLPANTCFVLTPPGFALLGRLGQAHTCSVQGCRQARPRQGRFN